MRGDAGLGSRVMTHRFELSLDRGEVTRLAAGGVERGGVARGETEEVQRGLF